MTDEIKTEVTETQTTVYMTKTEIEEVVASAVTRVFRDLGIAGPNSTLEEAKEFRSDLQFLRDWRELCELMRHKGIATGTMMIMAALAVVMLLGIKEWFFQ